MTLDDLIRGADPAVGRRFTGGTVEEARRLVDQLEADPPLVAGGRRARRPRGPWRISSVLVPACGILVAVLIIALAGLVGQGGRTHRSVGSYHLSAIQFALAAHRGPRSERRPLDRALIGELGILRQPQTAAARAFNTGPKLGVRLAQSVPYIPSLTRAIQLPHRVTLYLYVAQRREIDAPNHGGEHVLQGGLGFELRAPFQGFGGCCRQPQDLGKPVGPQATPYTMSQKPDWLYVELVPDGVATVRWTFLTTAAAGTRPTHGGRTVTVRAHNNVAATALPHPGTSNSSGTASVAWYSADGRLIARHTS